MQRYVTDIAIIGAGPSGLFAIFEAGMLKMKCHVIDSLDEIGGQCSALYPEKPIYDIPAHPNILAADLIESLKKQASPFNPTYHLGQTVQKLERIDQSYLLTTSKNTEILCKAVIIAAGCGAFGPNKPPIESIEEYENKSVFYHVRDKKLFSKKKLVIAGGGDSAADWTILLSDLADKIYLLHRRNNFRCAPEKTTKLQELMASGKVELIAPYQLSALEGKNGMIEKVIITDLDGNKMKLEADYLLAFFGLSMELGPILDFGLNINKRHIEVSPSTLQTSREAIYAIGDICHYEGKLKLILNGFAEAAMACYDIYKIIYPNQALHFEYSTTKGIVEA